MNNRIDLRNCVIYLEDGLSGVGACANKTNEKWTIEIAGVHTGTWTIVADAESSNAITDLATAAVVQGKLEAIEAIGEGNVSVTLADHTYTIELIGALAGTNSAIVFTTVVTSLGGGTATPTNTVQGGTGTAPVTTATTLKVASVVLNTTDVDLIPVGARFTIAGETTATTVHTVTARTPTSTGPTTDIVFTPALGAGTFANDAVLTFQAQQVEVKMGDGDFKWGENSQYKYLLDRGHLDSVITGDDVPLDITMGGTFEHVKSKSGETITPVEALKGIDAASEWVSSSSDACEPFAVDVVVVNTPPCGSVGATTYRFPDFRSEKRDYDIKASTLAFAGKCNAVEPIITRA